MKIFIIVSFFCYISGGILSQVVGAQEIFDTLDLPFVVIALSYGIKKQYDVSEAYRQDSEAYRKELFKLTEKTLHIISELKANQNEKD